MTQFPKDPNLKNVVLLGFQHGPPHMRKHMICHGITAFIFLILYLNWNGGIVPWFLREEPISRSDDPKLSIDILRHFPEAEHDGSKVTWVHGANNKIALQGALNGKVMMIEGDVSLRGFGTDKQEMLTVMGLPPATDTELTFEEWLEIVQGSSKGIKLVFHNIEAVELSLQKLRAKKHFIKGPIHLAADILQRQYDTKHPIPVDPQRFSRLVKTHFPRGTIVLGWVDAVCDSCHEGYTWDMVMNMQSMVESWDLKQPVSFSIRASIVRNSVSQINWLMEMTDQSSITLIAPNGESVPIFDLFYIRHKIPKNRLIYDLHADLAAQFTPIRDQGLEAMNAFRSANVHSMDQRAKEENTIDLCFRGQDWHVLDAEKSQKVYLGTQAVVMQNGMLVSKQQLKSNSENALQIQGSVEIFNFEKSVDQSKVNFDIFFGIQRAVRYSSVAGIKCQILLNGLVTLQLENLSGNEEEIAQATVIGDQPCFGFKIQYKENQQILFYIMRAKSCINLTLPNDISEYTKLELNLNSKHQLGKHIGLRHNNDLSMVAIDKLKIDF